MIRIDHLEETRQVAEKLASIVDGPLIICLSGDLGTGKTSFASFFLKKLLGEGQEITSPTFNIIHEYNHKFKIAHIDLYRLEKLEELYEIDLEFYLDNYLVLLEWPEVASPIMPKNHLWLKFNIIDENYRSLNIEFMGEKSEIYRQKFLTE